MKNYTKFASNFISYAELFQLGVTEDTGDTGPMFIENIKQSLFNCHIFETTNDIKRLLALTNCPNKNDLFHLPFPVMFLDVSFKRDEMKKLGINIGYKEIIGIIVAETYLFTDEYAQHMQYKIKSGMFDESILDKYDKNGEHKVGTGLRITICSIHDIEDHGRIWFDTFNVNVNIDDEYKDFNLNLRRNKGTDPHARKFIHLFTLNFLNFLNDKRVKLVNVNPDEKRNRKRVEKGKFPIPKRNVIKLSGDLKIYTEQLKKDKKTWEYSHSWWVRGHYRVLRDKEFWGEKAGTRIFIPPYIKGQGVLIKKTYEVDKTTSIDSTSTDDK